MPATTSALTAGAALAGVLLAIWLMQRAIRAFKLLPARTGTSRRLAIEEAIAIDPRRRLHLVRCGQQHVLLLTGGAQDVVVGWLGQPGAEP